MARFHLGVPLGWVGIGCWQTALTDDLWLRLFLLCLLDEIKLCVIFRWAASTSAQSHWRWGEPREREFGPSILTKYRLVHHCDYLSLANVQICSQSSYLIKVGRGSICFPFCFHYLSSVNCEQLFLLFVPLQIIVERAARSRAPDLDKKKYLVPSDLTGENMALNCCGWIFLATLTSSSSPCWQWGSCVSWYASVCLWDPRKRSSSLSTTLSLPPAHRSLQYIR